jgi:hypothetical protein
LEQVVNVSDLTLPDFKGRKVVSRQVCLKSFQILDKRWPNGSITGIFFVTGSLPPVLYECARPGLNKLAAVNAREKAPDRRIRKI